MLDTCEADVRESLVLDVALKNFKHGWTRGGSGLSFAERQEKKRTAWVKRCLRMRRRHWFSILNYLTFPALPRKERKIYIQRSSSTTTVRSQTNVTDAVAVSTVSIEIPSS